MSASSGIEWPESCGGKTTVVAKGVWQKCAEAGGDAALAEAIKNEKNWRFGYPPHIQRIAELLTTDKASAICAAGLRELREQLAFRSEGKVCSLAELAEKEPSTTSGYFTTTAVNGKLKEAAAPGVPYGSNLSGAALEKQLGEWASKGTCEGDVPGRIMEGMKKSGEISGKWFVLLGAGSEMGPLQPLLQNGANVLAVRTRRPKEWAEMKKFTENETCGKLFIPVDKSGAEGADILKEPLEIRDWVLAVLKEHAANLQDVTVGMYTYLDSEAHVRVTMGCDIIMEGIQKALKGVKVRLAYLCTNSMPLPIGKEAYDSVEKNRNLAGLWARGTGCPSPALSDCGDGLYLYHSIVVTQGPNYMLAKMAQLWRAMLCDYASLNVAPACYTLSVTHSATMKYLLNAMHLLPPNESFDPKAAKWLLFYLLCYDCLAGGDVVPKKRPVEVALTGSFHGGALRCGYNIEASKALSGMLYFYGRMFSESGPKKAE
ncbi:unnamed protein product [Amoebophrya sp. A25]|nr:unnamed protein product [Amoebophrya sp. A25]|eukprot:GSA25T00001525001.1